MVLEPVIKSQLHFISSGVIEEFWEQKKSDLITFQVLKALFLDLYSSSWWYICLEINLI